MLGSFTGWGGWPVVLAVATVVLAVATVALVIGVVLAAYTLGETRRTAQLSAAVDLLREYRSPKMGLARRTIYALPVCDSSKGLNQLLDGNRRAVELIGDYLDNIGTLVAQGLLKPEPAAAYLGGSARGMWGRLGPYIYAERAAIEKRALYQRHFEYLIHVFEGMPFEAEIDRLGRVPPS
jgi:hypothetical protein